MFKVPDGTEEIKLLQFKFNFTVMVCTPSWYSVNFCTAAWRWNCPPQTRLNWTSETRMKAGVWVCIGNTWKNVWESKADSGPYTERQPSWALLNHHRSLEVPPYVEQLILELSVIGEAFRFTVEPPEEARTPCPCKLNFGTNKHPHTFRQKVQLYGHCTCKLYNVVTNK